jgi:ribulose 1,5-bisphosphate synthetase/thiazole synthase
VKASGGYCLLGTSRVSTFSTEAKQRVVIIGGGCGGATAAKYIGAKSIMSHTNP